MNKINRDESMFLLCEENAELVEEFEKRGYKIKRHYRYIDDLLERKFRQEKEQQLPDINLGMTLDFGSGYPGYAVLGQSGAYRIMVLGSSTSQEDHYGLFGAKTWVDFLYEKFQDAGVDVEIFNGGMSTYNVQMMLLKLLRDLPDINPDMVICYSGGTNNGMYNFVKPECPFSNDFLKKIFQKAYCNDLNQKIFESVRDDVPEEMCADQLAKDHQYAARVMKSICDMEGIPFFNFFYSHDGMCDISRLHPKDREVFYHYLSFVRDEKGQKIANKFYKLIKENHEDWQYDHTEIFNQITKRVYFDPSHVMDGANQLIGDDVYRVIKPFVLR